MSYAPVMQTTLQPLVGNISINSRRQKNNCRHEALHKTQKSRSRIGSRLSTSSPSRRLVPGHLGLDHLAGQRLSSQIEPARDTDRKRMNRVCLLIKRFSFAILSHLSHLVVASFDQPSPSTRSGPSDNPHQRSAVDLPYRARPRYIIAPAFPGSV